MSFEDAPEQPPALNGEGTVAPAPTPLTRITRALVAVYRDQFERGPRHAHSHVRS